MLLFEGTKTQEERRIFGVASDMTCFCLSDVKEKVKAVFDNLIQLDHLNIVKFHKYWADVKENKARVSAAIRVGFSFQVINKVESNVSCCPTGDLHH